MDQNLPSQNPADDAQRFVQQFEQLWQGFDEKYAMLRNMRNGPGRAALALETSQELKDYLEAVDASPMEAQKRRLFEAHRYASDVVKRVRKRAEILFKFCSDVRSQCELERQRAIEDERRQREAQANLFAAQQRQAEIEHLKQIGKEKEAEVRAAAPVVPVTVNIDSDAGKPAGEIMIEVWVPKVDENKQFVFSDRSAYRHWIADHPEFDYLIEDKFGKVKKLLTDNHGLVQPPGLIIEQKYEPRTRKPPQEE
jgi:hypothetical protein